MSVSVRAESGIRHIDNRREDIIAVADQIWDYAELALHETRSAECLASALRDEGFTVEMGVADMPTAFVATWGSGEPVIGFLGEYDALAGLSQEPVPHRAPRERGAAGHGCGHNLLGAGAYGAAIGLKEALRREGRDGTVKFFGCPAEENLSGKAFMARDGIFDGCDVCLDWHPDQINRPSVGTTLANNAANFRFTGRSAHAAGDPHLGRSALDAVQLMNMGVEFLREHMPQSARVHYAITGGGGQPNVVPPVAEVWYLVRSVQRHEVDDLWERVIRCASGAAEMTETTYEVEMLKAIHNVLPNKPLTDLLFDCFRRVGPPQFGETEREFAAQIDEIFTDEQREAARLRRQIPESLRDALLCDVVLPEPPEEDEPRGSTDVGDVSWCCPVGRLRVACGVIGTPGHSWQFTAQTGMGIGHAGMMTAAKVLAEAGYAVATDADLLRSIRDDFARRTEGKPFESALAPEQKPAMQQFAGE